MREIKLGEMVITEGQVKKWLTELNAYRRSFEQVYWMASRYARGRESSVALTIYREAIARAERVGFVDLEKDSSG